VELARGLGVAAPAHSQLVVADLPIEILTHQVGLAPLHAALAHLSASGRPAGSARTVLHIEARCAAGPLPLSSPIAGGDDDRWLQRADGHTTLRTPDQLHHLDHSGWGLWWGQGSLADHPWEPSRPFHLLLDWWAARHRRYLVHAGAVGDQRGAVLLVGPGGSGKSTASLACVGSELSYLSDDYCLISVDEPPGDLGTDGPTVHSLYATGKVDERSRALLAHLDLSDAPVRADGKATVNVHQRWPESILRSSPLRAIVVPHVDTGLRRLRLEPIGAPAALLALAPSTMVQLMGTSEKLTVLSDLVRRVPAFALTVGRDLDAVPATLAGLLSP
jgi:hypothetical protein